MPVMLKFDAGKRKICCNMLHRGTIIKEGCLHHL